MRFKCPQCGTKGAGDHNPAPLCHVCDYLVRMVPDKVLQFTCPSCAFVQYGDRPPLPLCPQCAYLGELDEEPAPEPDLSGLPLRSRIVFALLPKGWVLRRLEAIEKLNPMALTPQALRAVFGVSLPQWFYRAVLWAGEREGTMRRMPNGTYALTNPELH